MRPFLACLFALLTPPALAAQSCYLESVLSDELEYEDAYGQDVAFSGSYALVGCAYEDEAGRA